VSRKNKWVPILVEMSTRIRNDGRTSLEKAQVQKKKEDLDDIYCKGKTKKNPINPLLLII
jgi:flagellar motor component MotA